ncbi:MAG: hypothetical protein DCC43_06350 [Candidatus Brocadia sp.]|uniref:Lipopolysaccharide-assembly n=1 Tax=Candidatus Brocadia fulgida TaxID=380242 RepID=A0A0M2UU64_9BACT|nr:MAG: hypothetical protein BROFUL_03302 [Candidatus Brocadia fulgida]MBV6467463.1 hypothetical protein [Anaerolineales bacterium]MCC6326122.1 LptE family protein [Candidatus Brocadia sp.]MCE7911550.1 hypothetical protein [Candidatus Brocadia sp. AMX3]MDG5997585.1 hypothetical protein [Candidatus Brocadia sp.]
MRLSGRHIPSGIILYDTMVHHRYHARLSRNKRVVTKETRGVADRLSSLSSLRCGKTGGRKDLFPGKMFFQRNRSTSIVCLTVVMFFIAAVVGCGYSSRSLLRSNVRSIYVPIFDNNTFRRGYEFDLTKAVRDQILLRTRLRVVDKDEADSILFGKITSFNEGVTIENRNDNIIESRTSVGIEIQWVDKRTGRAIVPRKNISKAAEFIVPRNETLTSSGTEAFVNVARGIVDAMEEDW